MSTTAKPQPANVVAAPTMKSLHSRSYTAWASNGRFTKNPDLVRLPTGRLLFIYSDNDQHWSQETQILTLVASDDDGKTWYKFNEIARANLRKGDERMVTPRLSLLADGRLVALIDHDDFGHFHEDQPLGNWIFWSSDGGKTWSKPEVPNIPGFEPDRVVELPDGTLAVGSHVMRGDSMEFADILSTSSDGGKTWRESATIAHDGYHRYCEGAVVVLDRRDGKGKELACVLRQNHCSGVPSLVSFSQDNGLSWSTPQLCPFAIHRPYAKQLPDGRVLVTGRHVNGVIGTVAWCGNLRAEAGHPQVGGPRHAHLAALSKDALVIDSKASGGNCRYSMLPAESNRSEVTLEATLKVGGGEAGKPLALMSLAHLMANGRPALLCIGADYISFNSERVDDRKRVDMTRLRTITMHHRRGLLRVLVDGEIVINQCILREGRALGEWFGNDAGGRTCFGSAWDAGTSWWQSVDYRAVNPSHPDHRWSWKASDGVHPDDYQRRRLVLLHGNPPGEDKVLDNGYSSWVVMPDGSIQFVDYSSQGDPPSKAHIVGLRFRPEEIPS